MDGMFDPLPVASWNAQCSLSTRVLLPTSDPPGTTLYFKAFEEMMQELDGRPHWAKTYSMIGADFQRSLPHWEDFKNVRAKMDPDGLFTNPYLERLFSS